MCYRVYMCGVWYMVCVLRSSLSRRGGARWLISMSCQWDWLEYPSIAQSHHNTCVVCYNYVPELTAWKVTVNRSKPDCYLGFVLIQTLATACIHNQFTHFLRVLLLYNYIWLRHNICGLFTGNESLAIFFHGSMYGYQWCWMENCSY